MHQMHQQHFCQECAAGACCAWRVYSMQMPHGAIVLCTNSPDCLVGSSLVKVSTWLLGSVTWTELAALGANADQCLAGTPPQLCPPRPVQLPGQQLTRCMT